MKRIVVGSDGSEGATNALRWASRLAASQDAEIVVMTGFVPTDSELPPQRVETLLAEQEARLEAWSQPAHLDDVAVRTVVERGDPRPGILAVADRESADLVVVGRTGASAGPGLLHIGSMAEWLAHHVDRPLAVIGGEADPMIRKVLVGVDASEGSRAAVSWVSDLRDDADVRVVAASVDQDADDDDPTKTWQQELERRILDEYTADLVQSGVEVRPLALNGTDVAAALLKSADDEHTDLLVLGTRGLGGFSGLRIGGVTLKLLHRANQPLVIVPPA